MKKKLLALAMAAALCANSMVSMAASPDDHDFRFEFRTEDASTSEPYWKNKGPNYVWLLLYSSSIPNKVTNLIVVADDGHGTRLTEDTHLLQGQNTCTRYKVGPQYYGWYSGNVRLRGNSTETGTGYNVTGTWNPNITR